MVLVKLLTCKSSCPDNYSKYLYNHYMEHLVNTQAFQKGCKIINKSITSLHLQHTSEIGFARMKFTPMKNASITQESLLNYFHIPEDLMQVNLWPDMPPSEGYENIITAVDVFSRYAFAFAVSNPTALDIKSYSRYHDKTRLFTYTHYNRQKKRFRLPSYTLSSPKTKH